MFRNLIGDRSFYRKVLSLMIPVMIQTGISNFVNMLDNVMVGQVGTNPMSGTSVANQLIFVFNLCVFGCISGAGIFGAQFFGKGDHESLRSTMRFKILAGLLICAAGIAIFTLAGEPLIGLYLKGDGTPEDAAETLKWAKEYLFIICVSFVPYTLAQCYASTMRESGQAVVPMAAGIAAMLTNLVLNYLLIFGHLGLPALGVAGAAWATTASRFVELAVVAIYAHTHRQKCPFVPGLYRSLRVPGQLVRRILMKGLPLMLNETMWAAGMAICTQCYSLRGLDVIAAFNISSTFANIFAVAFHAVGTAISILLGQQLGAGHSAEAKKDSGKLIAFSSLMGVLGGVLLAGSGIFIPQFYNTSDAVRLMATQLMWISAFSMPIEAFANACYYTLRSGGRIGITILFDSGFVWAVTVPAALILGYLTGIPILPMFAVVQGLNLIKCAAGYTFVHKGVWVRDLTKLGTK